MKIGIVGLPNVGKSTLFNALTRNYSADAQNFPFCTIEPNIGIVNVNDKRLEKIRVAVNGQKIIPATCEFIDIAGIVEGASKGEGLGNKFLANIREANAILQVVRIFRDDDVIHVNGKVDPKKDIEIINSELILADIETLERRIIDNARKAKSSKEALEAQIIYERVFKDLNEGKLAIDVIKNEEQEYFLDLHLLTNKKFVYAANVSEDMMDISQEELQEIIGVKNSKIVPICAKLEADMIEMSLEERENFLTEMGLITTGLDNLIKASFESLGLQYYFTAGEKEVRAWTIPIGATAPQAAGVIHTDFEKGFIKADTVNWKDLVEFGGWHGAREKAKVRLEGKDYIVQDGDVMLFKFNN
ncbi:MAG: redox-regulated ATPase YchF [Candidatus Gracilibacteria bacterium]|nr:redox-regulated ATPase YchF [Candidatus Gracilibacteria bacterium]